MPEQLCFLKPSGNYAWHKHQDFIKLSIICSNYCGGADRLVWSLQIEMKIFHLLITLMHELLPGSCEISVGFGDH